MGLFSDLIFLLSFSFPSHFLVILPIYLIVSSKKSDPYARLALVAHDVFSLAK